VTKKLGLNWN